MVEGRLEPSLRPREKLSWLGLEDANPRHNPWQPYIDYWKEEWDFADFVYKLGFEGQTVDPQHDSLNYGADWMSWGDLRADTLDATAPSRTMVEERDDTEGGENLIWDVWNPKLAGKYLPTNFSDEIYGPESQNWQFYYYDGDGEAVYAYHSSWKTFVAEFHENYNSWADFENAFTTGREYNSSRRTLKGNAAGGIRVFEEQGLTRDGFNVPPGTVEVYGPQIHFSRIDREQIPYSGDSEEMYEGMQIFDFSNYSVSTTDAVVGENVYFNVSVENTTEYEQPLILNLMEDGQVVISQHHTVYGDYSPFEPGEVKDIEFYVFHDEPSSYTYILRDQEWTVSWTPSDLNQ